MEVSGFQAPAAFTHGQSHLYPLDRRLRSFKIRYNPLYSPSF